MIILRYTLCIFFMLMVTRDKQEKRKKQETYIIFQDYIR